MDNRKRVYNDNPLLKANFLSRLYFCWLTPLMKLGQKKPLEEEDLYRTIPPDESEYLTNKLEKEWKKEIGKEKPSLFKAILRVWVAKFALLTFLPFIEESIRIIQPLLVRNLIRYFNGQIDLQWALIYGSLLCLNTAILGIIHHPFFFASSHECMRVRIAASGLIYRKALTLNSAHSAGTDSSGKIINLLANDATRLEYMLLFSSYLIIGPLEAIVVIILLLQMIDITILGGVLLLAVVIPLQSFLGKVMNSYRLKAAKVTDERISFTSEILNGIKVVKMYCWEEPFKKIIEKLRTSELKHYSKVFGISALNSSIDMDLPSLITYASVALFVNFVNKPLLPAYVVFIMAYYIRICGAIGFWFIRGLTFLIAGIISCERIQELLLRPDTDQVLQKCEENEVRRIYTNNLSASWDKSSKAPVLQKISLEVKENELLAVVGAVGAGKSSLLMALLGEMPSIKGDIKLNGSIFYVSQEPWIFSSTIKQNILFGKEYSKDKFSRIIKACSLRDDLKMLPNGENTLIGDKGVNLSGGQRARVNLARALYHDPDIYLFDDPLSAVDASVAKELFDNCINGYLKSKVRILVTHQVHHLSKANEIIIMSGGQIQARGKYHDLLRNSSINLSSLLADLEIQKLQTQTSEISCYSRRASRTSEADTQFIDLTELASSQMFAASMKDIKEAVDQNTEYDEAHTTGTIGWKVYKSLLSFGAASVVPFIVLFLFILAQTAITCSDYWLSYWATQEEAFSIANKAFHESCKFNQTCDNLTNITIGENIDSPYPNRNRNFLIYTILISISVGAILIRSFVFFASALLISKRFHNDMLRNMMQAKIRFFDLNPIGRIMNRFTKDIGNIDDVLPLTVFDFLHCLSIVLSAIVVAIYINFWIMIPLVPIAIVFVYLRKYFIIVSRETKRIEGLCRSPIYVHTNNTLVGITTIRACQIQRLLTDEYNVHSNYHTQAYFAFLCVNRWFAVRTDVIITVYSIIVVYGCILAQNFMPMSPGQVGLVLVYGFQIMSLFQWTIRQSAEVENLMTSVERIREYTTIKGEDLKTGKKKADVDWPAKGKIEFENVSFAYDDNLAPVLKDLSMTIDAHEKIGIVGRTGAGKSTFFQALYRMAEPSGRILIDGVDIKDVGLHELRSKISIIPQEPTLFTGTIRYNLDPFGLSEDSTLWNTLEIVQLKEAVKEMKDGLDSLVQKGGSNLSVGQKQLFCLARAILKKSKILIIDEATANVDLSTDALVQKAIRECFKECTVITIAHRLQTIMDSDRILCLSSGQLINYDTPYELLQDKQSILYELVHKLGKREEERMLEIAEKHAVEKELNMNNNTDGTHINDETTYPSETDALLKR